MKKFLVLVILALFLVACSSKTETSELDVAVAFYPMKDILELVAPDLEADGVKIKIHEFTDYQTPNNLLKDKEMDANMIQHQYFLDAFNNANNSDLTLVMPIYHATFALYSPNYTNLDDIPQKAQITVPDDATNFSRALYLLHQAGLIQLDLAKAPNFSEADILSNPKELSFADKVPLTSLSQRYVETELAIMYPTYAKSLELSGDEQRLYVETSDAITEGFAISLVARSDNHDSEAIQKLVEVLKTDKVRNFLIENYGWASTPAF